MIRTIAGAALGLLVLGAGIMSPVHAARGGGGGGGGGRPAQRCTRHTCKAQITAECAGLSGRQRSQCATSIVSECKMGAGTCVSSPSGAFVE